MPFLPSSLSLVSLASSPKLNSSPHSVQSLQNLEPYSLAPAPAAEHTVSPTVQKGLGFPISLEMSKISIRAQVGQLTPPSGIQRIIPQVHADVVLLVGGEIADDERSEWSNPSS
ncbi:hypothetical protein CALVIDRAFT_542492 [Calocera viscosa TUFC12733]|uniref:Uncharacterized protein n=1 Tax=Calocera viscosa (strain TUFC12733) TaxID=1330018 RepID=A0A167GJK2_CALVF|nr:hypothetical protein CALVIDRAFT_542492 [Calocera viscosa TUFC12733]